MDRQGRGEVVTGRAEVGGLNQSGEIGTEARDEGVCDATETALRTTGDTGEAASGRGGTPRDIHLARARMDRQDNGEVVTRRAEIGGLNERIDNEHTGAVVRGEREAVGTGIRVQCVGHSHRFFVALCVFLKRNWRGVDDGSIVGVGNQIALGADFEFRSTA